MNVFPTLIGIGWPVTVTPLWNNLLQKTVTGRVVAATYQQYPLYKFKFQYNYLSAADYNTLLGFFNQQGGNLTPFWFDAGPGNDSVTAQDIGTGDGSTTTFTLLRSYGGYVEPVAAVYNQIAYQTRYGLAEVCESQAKQNLLVESNLFNNASYWTPTAVTFSTGQTSPDGLNDAINVIETTANSEHVVAEWITLTAGVTYTLSVWVRGSASRYLQMQMYSASDGATAAFDYNGGAAPSTSAIGTGSSVSADMVAYSAGAGGGSGYRCRLTFTCGTTGVHQIYLGPSNVKAAGASYAGDGSSYVTLWGAQLENNFRASLYVPTGGSASTNQPDYTLNNSGPATVAFTTAPTVGSVITWTGNYYFQVRFSQGSQDIDEFMSQLYSTQQIELETYF